MNRKKKKDTIKNNETRATRNLSCVLSHRSKVLFIVTPPNITLPIPVSNPNILTTYWKIINYSTIKGYEYS